MLKGVLYALNACFIWGLIFIVPQFMTGFTAFEVAVGRYTVYGLVSWMIFSKAKLQGRCKYAPPVWKKALLLSLAGTFGYYIFVVLSLRYATPAICALVLGISPITIAFFGNLTFKECNYKSLILPSLFILSGLVIINILPIMSAPSPSTYLLGLLSALLALASWSWYVIVNSRFLKKNPTVHSHDWATLLGVCTGFWVLVFTLIPVVFLREWLDFATLGIFNEPLAHFLWGSAVLGLLCSWVGATLWNLASFYLPVSLAGQLTIFETIFGLLFVYALERRTPPLLEIVGILFLLAGIFFGIRQAARSYSAVGESSRSSTKLDSETGGGV